MLGLAMAGLAVTVPPASADDVPALHLVSGPDFKPFSDPDLPKGGMVAEIVAAAFAAIGDKAVLDFEPWARGYADTRQLKYDGTFPYAHNADRDRDFLFSDLVYAQLAHPYVLAGSPWSAQDPAALAGKTMCNPLGYVVQPPIHDLVESGAIRVESPPSMAHCFKMLQAGRVDFVDCTDVQAKAVALQVFGTVNAVRPLAAVIGNSGSYFIISRDRPGGARLMVDFNRGLALLKQSGAYDSIVQRHLTAYFGQVSN